MRHVRGVFHTLKLDVRPLAGEGWLALYVEPEALEIIRAAGRRTCRTEPQTGYDTTQDNDTRDILIPSGGRRAGVGRMCTQTSFEVVK